MPDSTKPTHSLARLSSVRIDLRGLHARYHQLYPDARREVTYTVEVVRKVRKRASPKKGETTTNDDAQH